MSDGRPLKSLSLGADSNEDDESGASPMVQAFERNVKRLKEENMELRHLMDLQSNNLVTANGDANIESNKLKDEINILNIRLQVIVFVCL